jgi:hypothetical protein
VQQAERVAMGRSQQPEHKVLLARMILHMDLVPEEPVGLAPAAGPRTSAQQMILVVVPAAPEELQLLLKILRDLPIKQMTSHLSLTVGQT